MPNDQLIKSLAKVLVAAAWADGEFSNDELNSLKDLLFHLPGMNAQDWAEIDIYIDSPVGPEERDRLIAELQAQLTTQEQRDAVIAALDEMAEAAGEMNDSETEVIEAIRSDILSSSAHVGGLFGRFTRGRSKQRTQTMAGSPNREAYLDDFVRNKIYYDLNHKPGRENAALNMPDAELRRLSLAGGLMARVAYVDRQVSEAENERIVQVLQKLWELSALQASLVVETSVSEIASGMDYYRLVREFFEATTEEDRLRFVDVLFAVAASDGQASDAEMEEIRTISYGLLLTHQQFIDAKLKIPREQREF